MSKVLIMGAGYVGLAHAALFARETINQVTIVDTQLSKVEAINQGKSPLAEVAIADFLAQKPQNLKAVLAGDLAYSSYDAIFLCLPTNYDEVANQFDTSILDQVLGQIVTQVEATPLIIKSTLPIGYTERKIAELNYPWLIFSPEFLREGQALQDNLRPSRLIIGSLMEDVFAISNFYLEVVKNKDVPVLIMRPSEAESVKLFANTYLAMRVAFFNELDTFSEVHDLDSHKIIKGVGLDPRIGRFYNNPSFGYGGYCLPKDSKQLRSNFEGVPADLIGAIVTSNDRRKDFITQQILKKPGQVIGIYRLSMKHDSDNSRESAVLEIMAGLRAAGRCVVVYEPSLQTDLLSQSYEIETNFDHFCQKCDIILANRRDAALEPVSEKVYSRDYFGMD